MERASSGLSTRSLSKRDFWDGKLLRWESDKYRARSGLLKSIDFNASVKLRQSLALSAVSSICHDKTVLELGCGSALLMEKIVAVGARSYVGVDFCPSAIASARERADRLGISDRVRLIEADVATMSGLSSDICFSLGLLDWLSPEEAAATLRRFACEFYLHSFSEREAFSPSQIMHRAYVFMKYGHATGSYIPIYRDRREVEHFVAGAGLTSPTFIRRRQLHFSCFATNIPETLSGV